MIQKAIDAKRDATNTLRNMSNIQLPRNNNGHEADNYGNRNRGGRGYGRGQGKRFYVNNQRNFYQTFTDHVNTLIVQDDELYHANINDDDKAIIDGGCNRSMIIKKEIVKNIASCKRIIRGYDQTAQPTPVTQEGTIAGIPAIVNENGSRNLLAHI